MNYAKIGKEEGWEEVVEMLRYQVVNVSNGDLPKLEGVLLEHASRSYRLVSAVEGFESGYVTLIFEFDKKEDK